MKFPLGLPITIHADFDQRTPDWHELREPNIGASEAHIVMAGGKNGKDTAAKGDLRIMKALAQCGIHQPPGATYQSADMARGIELESAARIAFEFATGLDVQEVAYISSDVHPIGCSPDGLLGETGILEIKCPKPRIAWATHQLHSDGLPGIPPGYHPQIYHALAVTGREVLIWCSYCPSLGPDLEVCLRAVHASEITDQIDAYLEKLRQFLAEIDAEAERIRAAIIATKEGI
jgi:predicted phage-related endonuclease